MKPSDQTFLCYCCYRFYDPAIEDYVEIPYNEMPAHLAIELMSKRNGVLLRHPKTKRSDKRKQQREKQRKNKQNRQS